MEARKDERRARGERSRQAILQAALKTLGEGGLEGFTARNVARRAGVSSATIFHHFASLDELQLEAIMLLLDAALDEELKAPPRNVRGYLRALGALSFRVVREQPEFVHISNALFGKLPFSEPLRQRAQAHYARWVGEVDRQLAALGVGAPKRRRNVSLALVLLLDGMGIHWSVHHDVEQLECFWKAMVDLFAAQLSPVRKAGR
jgi:AcrR family transcriptional regulator